MQRIQEQGKICAWGQCARVFYRKRRANGRLESLKEFEARDHCCRDHYLKHRAEKYKKAQATRGDEDVR